MKKYVDENYLNSEIENLNAKIHSALKPPPSVTSYSRPTSIPIISGMLLVFYAACAGTFTFTMGDKIFSHTVTSVNDVVWALWIQTSDIDGSFIFPSGTRTYLTTNEIVSESSVSFVKDPSYLYDNPNYIVITIE